MLLFLKKIRSENTPLICSGLKCLLPIVAPLGSSESLSHQTESFCGVRPQRRALIDLIGQPPSLKNIVDPLSTALMEMQIA